MAPARDGWAPINLQGSPWFSVGSGQAFTYQPARFPVLITTCRLQIERKPIKTRFYAVMLYERYL